MIEVVTNQLSADGMKFVKVLSDKVLAEEKMLCFVPGAARDVATVKCYDTAALSLFYGEVTFPVRGVVEIPTGRVGKVRRLAAWRMVESEGYRMSEIIEFLGQWYFVQTKRKPQYAFVKSLPKNIERFTDVDGLTLLDVNWCLEKTVMVGG
jgi:hypothetical protein